jgi:hypothetical protein
MLSFHFIIFLMSLHLKNNVYHAVERVQRGSPERHNKHDAWLMAHNIIKQNFIVHNSSTLSSTKLDDALRDRIEDGKPRDKKTPIDSTSSTQLQ